MRGMLNACMAFLAALKSCDGSYAYSVCVMMMLRLRAAVATAVLSLWLRVCERGRRSGARYAPRLYSYALLRLRQWPRPGGRG